MPVLKECCGPVGFSFLPASTVFSLLSLNSWFTVTRTLSSSLSALFSGSGARLFSHPDYNVWLIE